MAVPDLNDQFWFEYSGTMVKDSIQRLNQAINSVKTFTKGLLIAYPVASIAIIDYKDIDKWWLLLIFVLPHAFWLFAAWQGTSAVLPKSVSFDPRIPDDIRRAYIETHTYKEKELNKAVTISLITTVLASIALIVGTFLGNYYARQEELIKLQGPSFNAEYIQEDKEVSVAGNFPPDKKLFVSVTNYYSNGKKKVVYNKQHITAKEGVFAINIDIDTVGVKSIVEILWAESNFSRAILKEVSTVKGPL